MKAMILTALAAAVLGAAGAASAQEGPADDGGAPGSTTTTTTTAPTTRPPNVSHRPIGTSSVVLFPAFLPDPFRPDGVLGLDAALAATGTEGPVGPARPLPIHPEPVLGGSPTLVTTGSSLPVQYVPPAILGVLIAWATLTLFEFGAATTRRRGDRDEGPIEAAS